MCCEIVGSNKDVKNFTMLIFFKAVQNIYINYIVKNMVIMFLCLLTGFSALIQKKKNMFSVFNGGRLFQLLKVGY